jgi:protein-S-isoprenylcysteine O-methyltransferase Ste14
MIGVGEMDRDILQVIIPVLWSGWLLYWMAAARHVKPVRWQEPVASRTLHRVPLVLAGALLIPGWLGSFMTVHVLPQGPFLPAVGAILVVAGLGFATWARRHLGGNWSGVVTLKDDHSLIQTGPYRYVRHPIYTGLLLAFLGTAVAIGEWRGFLAVALALLGFWRKIHVEELAMRETFAEYERYRQTTAALIPFVI